MSTLRISLATGTENENDDPQDIRITHLTARELSVNELASPYTTTPGIIIVIPVGQSFTLQIKGRNHLLMPGTVSIFNGQEKRELYSSKSEEGDIMVRIIELNAMINEAVPLVEMFHFPIVFDPDVSENMEQLYELLIHERQSFTLPASNQDIYGSIIGARLMLHILTAVARYGEGQVSGGKDEKELAKLKAFMVRYMSTNPSGAEMAKYMGMSRAKFYRWSKALLGETPVQYLRHLRLQKGQELLRNTSLSMEAIAEQTGFSSRHHFTREFSKYFQVSPAKLQGHVKQDVQNIFEEVEGLISENRLKAALDLSSSTLAKESVLNRDRLREQKARCLYGLAKVEDALREWEDLKKSSVAWPAARELSKHYFRVANYDQALANLKEVFPVVTKTEQSELIQTWIHQLTALISMRDNSPVYDYVHVRQELFPDNERSMWVTVDALIGLGRENLILDHCPKLRSRCFFALRRSGFPQEALEKYADDVPADQVPITLLQMGRFKEVLEKKGKAYPKRMVAAYCELGQPEEAITRYPDDCQQALMLLGRYEEFLERFPEPSAESVWALYQLQRWDDLASFPKTVLYHWQLAQLCLDPESFVELGKTDQTLYHGALIWVAVRCARQGKMQEALAYLDRYPLLQSTNFWWPDMWSNCVFKTVLLGILGKRDLMYAELRKLYKDNKYTNYQRNWYDAAFLLGEIDSDDYLRQPKQMHIDLELALMTAYKYDLEGDAAKALTAYEDVAQTDSYPILYHYPMVKDFIAWRKEVLA